MIILVGICMISISALLIGSIVVVCYSIFDNKKEYKKHVFF